MKKVQLSFVSTIVNHVKEEKEICVILKGVNHPLYLFGDDISKFESDGKDMFSVENANGILEVNGIKNDTQSTFLFELSDLLAFYTKQTEHEDDFSGTEQRTLAKLAKNLNNAELAKEPVNLVGSNLPEAIKDAMQAQPVGVVTPEKKGLFPF